MDGNLNDLKLGYEDLDHTGSDYSYIIKWHTSSSPYSTLLEKISNIVKKLSIGDDVINIGYFTNLEILELGKDIHSVNVTNASKSLTEIQFLSPIPPTVNGTGFTNSHYMGTVLKVPQGSLEDYMSTEPWKNFWEIQSYVPTDVEEVNQSTETTEIARYDLYGRSVSDDYEGIVIIRYSDGSSKKVLNRNI